MMPRIRFISALVISIALVGGALWFKFGNTNDKSSDIVAVQNAKFPSNENTFLADFTNNSEVASTSTKPLSQTDILSRQLFSDFIALKSQGQITPKNINALATKYATSISNTDISDALTPQVNINQIIIVPDSRENMVAYGNTVTNIRNKYKDLVIIEYNKDTNLTNPDSSALFDFLGATGRLYRAATEKLLATKVPASLAENHLNLIRNYQESAALAELINNTTKDPMRSLVAVNNYVRNTEKEGKLLLNIRVALIAYGVSFNN